MSDLVINSFLFGVFATIGFGVTYFVTAGILYHIDDFTMWAKKKIKQWRKRNEQT